VNGGIDDLEDHSNAMPGYPPSNKILAAWLSGNALVMINVVALRLVRLVLGWVTVRGIAGYHLGI